MGSKVGAGVATPERFGTEQIGGCQLDEDERHGATEDAKALPRDEELAVGDIARGQRLDGLYGIESHELDATLGKVSEDGFEVDTNVFGKALKTGDVDSTKPGEGDVTAGVVSDEDETGNIASIEAGGSEKCSQIK